MSAHAYFRKEEVNGLPISDCLYHLQIFIRQAFQGLSITQRMKFCRKEEEVKKGSVGKPRLP